MASKRVDSMSLEQLREAIAATQLQLRDLDSAVLPLAEAEQQLEAAVDRLAGCYTPGPALAAFFHPGADGADLEVMHELLPDARFDAIGAAALIAALHRDALLALLKARLRAAAPDMAAVVPLADRAAEAQRLQETLHDLEMREERWIVDAERRGQMVDRRPDVDPRVLFDPRVLEEPGPPAA